MSGLPDVLQKFYKDQLNQLEKKDKENVTHLCEEGLISVSDRRLSLEQEEIKRNFKVLKPVLDKLVNSRLLRAESRVGSVYYELSHDTLIKPIRKAQKELKIQKEIKSIKKKYYFNKLIVISLWCMILIFIYLKRTNFCLYIGNAFYFLEQQEIAISMYNKVITFDPKLATAYNNLASAYKALDRYEEAIVAYNKAIELDSKDGYPYNGLGNAYKGLKKYEKAIISYIKAIELNPKDTMAYENLDNLRKSYKKFAIQRWDWYEKAIDALNKDIELPPLDPKYAYTNPYRHLGNIYRGLKRYEEAIEAYHKAIELDPKYDEAKVNLSEVLIIKGDTDNVLSMLYEMIKKKDIDQDEILASQFNIICALLIEKRRIEAYEELKKLIQYYKSKNYR